jgi:hypothetical protein
MKIKEIYKFNKSKKVGDACKCPSCGNEFVKSNYQQIFCRSKGDTICKDKYWNTITPTKRNNTTRISPASAAWMVNQKSKPRYTTEGYEIINGVAYDEWDEPVYDIDIGHDDHPFSTEALGQW